MGDGYIVDDISGEPRATVRARSLTVYQMQNSSEHNLDALKVAGLVVEMSFPVTPSLRHFRTHSCSAQYQLHRSQQHNNKMLLLEKKP